MVLLVSSLIAAVSPVEPAANSASVTPCLRIVFNIIALSTVAIYARARVVIDQRHGNIRQQNGKRHAVRITTEAADEPDQQASEGAKDQTAAVGC